MILIIRYMAFCRYVRSPPTWLESGLLAALPLSTSFIADKLLKDSIPLFPSILCRPVKTLTADGGLDFMSFLQVLLWDGIYARTSCMHASSVGKVKPSLTYGIPDCMRMLLSRIRIRWTSVH